MAAQIVGHVMSRSRQAWQSLGAIAKRISRDSKSWPSVVAFQLGCLRLVLRASAAQFNVFPGQNHKLSKDPRLEERFCTSILHDQWRRCLDFPVDTVHLPNAWLIGAPHQCIAQFPKKPFGLVIVNIRICAVQVTQGFRHTPTYGLKKKPGVVRFWSCLKPPKNKAEFEGHIESGSLWASRIELNP